MNLKQMLKMSLLIEYHLCLNIHKNLRSYALHKLQSNHNISTSFIYPDNNQLKKDTLKKTLEDI